MPLLFLSLVMVSERGKRRIERLLDEADEAVSKLDWETVRDRAQAALVFDPENPDALELLSGAERALAGPVPSPNNEPTATSVIEARLINPPRSPMAVIR